MSDGGEGFEASSQTFDVIVDNLVGALNQVCMSMSMIQAVLRDCCVCDTFDIGVAVFSLELENVTQGRDLLRCIGRQTRKWDNRRGKTRDCLESMNTGIFLFGGADASQSRKSSAYERPVVGKLWQERIEERNACEYHGGWWWSLWQ